MVYKVDPGGYDVAPAVDDVVYSIPSRGGASVRLSPEFHSRIWSIRFSHDGSMVEYEAETPDGRAGFLVPAGGGEPRLREAVPPPWIEDGFGLWSPDGSRAIFIQGESLYRWSPGSADPVLLAELGSWERGSEVFSPDGRYVAVVATEQSPSADARFRPSHINIVSLDGGEMRRVTADDVGTEKDGLSWHPDGARLTYSCNAENRVRTTRMAYLDGRPTTLFHHEPGIMDIAGAWAPDGLTYYFIGWDEERGENTYRWDSDGSVEMVWEGGGLPQFSADGRTLMYTVWEYSYELWMMEGFGSG